ncbi:hypothetical protein RND81_01G126200 [Saponaria officinalis]|uniref:CRIB domain-containing protein n=1 Tax=Saponaria officinalis TaxID=3572 RepID=A0AAW1N7D1_SAPOF
MSKNMKGLLKGLRYISQIFEEEEEKEIQIGFPTDVKHVAHIGWDGPSVASPSWMNEFKSEAPGNASSNGDAEEVEWVSQDSTTTKKTARDSAGRDLPTLPKSSRRQPSMDSIGSTDSPVGSPTQKNKSSKRRSKQKENSNNSPRGGESSNSQGLPNIPKKTRRKKSKESADGSVKSSSSKSREKSSRHGSKHGSDDGSITNKNYSGEVNPNLGLASLKEDEVKE